MAWNGSDRKVFATTSKREMLSVTPQHRGKRVWWIALFVTLFCGGVILVIHSEKNEMTPVVVETTKKSRVIVQSTNIVKTVGRKVEEPVIRSARGQVIPEGNLETYVDGRGVLRYKKGDGRVPNPEDFKNPIMIERNSCIPAFRHEVESEIAMLLTVEPGEPIVGEADYRRTNQDFVESLVDKIEISEEDTPFAREIKEAVIEMKKELAERIKNGESLVEILKEARSELQRSAAYRDQIDDLLREQLNDPNATDADLKVTLEAANKMLESKGIAPIKETRFLCQRKRIARAREKNAAAVQATIQ